MELVLVQNYLAPTQDPFTHLFGTKSGILGWQKKTLGITELWTLPKKTKEITQNVKSLRHGAFVDSQSIFWIFATVAEQVSRIMAPEEESVKTFYSLSYFCTEWKSQQWFDGMRLVLLPVYICQCDTLQRHFQVDSGCSEGSRGLERGGDCLLHRARACQHLSGDSV